MNNVDPIEMFPKVEKMICKFAWQYSETYPVSFEEARSEAYYAFMRACADYRPEEKTKFSSWCYFWIWTHLKTWITKRTVEPITFMEINEEMVGTATPDRAESLELVDDLSEDAKEIISLILETPSEISASVVTVRRLLGEIKRYLVKKGRSKKRVESAHKEICVRFQSAWAMN